MKNKLRVVLIAVNSRQRTKQLSDQETSLGFKVLWSRQAAEKNDGRKDRQCSSIQQKERDTTNL